MTKMFCEHCGKDITNDNTAYIEVNLLDDLFGDSLYDTIRSEKYFGKKYIYFDLCSDCFKKLGDNLFSEVRDFLTGGIENDNN